MSVPSLVLLALTSCSPQLNQRRCETNRDCTVSEQCLDGRCERTAASEDTLDAELDTEEGDSAIGLANGDTLDADAEMGEADSSDDLVGDTDDASDSSVGDMIIDDAIADGTIVDDAIDDDAIADDTGLASDTDETGQMTCPPPGSESFPPFEVDVVAPTVFDLDGDELDDLLLADTVSKRIFVMRGSACGFGEVFDYSLLADETTAYAMAVAELGDDNYFDLVLLGATDQTTQLAIYEGTGAIGFAAQPLVQTVTNHLPSFVPDAARRTFVAVGDVDGDDRAELALGHDTEGIWLAELPASLATLEQPSFESMSYTALPVPEELATTPGTWAGDPLGVFVPSVADGLFQDLLVITLAYVFHYGNDGVGGLASSPNTAATRLESNQFVVPYDISGDGVVEVFGARTGQVNVTQFNVAGDSYRMVLSGGVGSVDGLAVAQFDGVGGPEVVALETTGEPSHVVVYENTSLDEGADRMLVRGDYFSADLPAGFVPDFIVTGNFIPGDEPELVVIDADVGVRCFRVSTAGLAACPTM